MSKLGECDVFFTCRLGVGIPTKCSEGLHYSEEVTKLDLVRRKQKKKKKLFLKYFLGLVCRLELVSGLATVNELDVESPKSR